MPSLHVLAPNSIALGLAWHTPAGRLLRILPLVQDPEREQSQQPQSQLCVSWLSALQRTVVWSCCQRLAVGKMACRYRRSML